MKAVGISQDYSEPFIVKQLQQIASSSINLSRVRDELHKEHSRRKIDRVRFHNGIIINAGNANGANSDPSENKGMGFNNDE